MDYRAKYLKYKTKYIILKGGDTTLEFKELIEKKNYEGIEKFICNIDKKEIKKIIIADILINKFLLNKIVNDLKILEMLLKNGIIEIDIKDKGGMTMLMWASNDNKINLARLLLKYGANKEIINEKNHNKPAIRYAKTEEMIKLLKSEDHKELDNLNIYIKVQETIKGHYKTHIPEEIKKKIREVRIEEEREYKIKELNGFLSHGIYNNIFKLMQILRDGSLLSKSEIKNKVGFHTSDIVSDNSYISFGILGTASFIEYGKDGILFLNNKIFPDEIDANRPYEMLISKKIELKDLIIGVDKKLKTERISSLKIISSELKFKKDIIKFLQEEIDKDYIIIDKEEDIINDDKIFYKHYHILLQKILNMNNPYDGTIIELIKKLICKYNSDIKLVYIDYE